MYKTNFSTNTSIIFLFIIHFFFFIGVTYYITKYYRAVCVVFEYMIVFFGINPVYKNNNHYT